MTIREHKKYLDEFTAYLKDVTSTEEKAKGFLSRAGIITPTGQLKKNYKTAACPDTANK
ncbi:MAG: hypothetical protein K8R90_11850 [Candidatus Cloacimonetes bacterium]|nr:hypothetical protein [Candidatus Cloacimonadota bacterium]